MSAVVNAYCLRSGQIIIGGAVPKPRAFFITMGEREALERVIFRLAGWDVPHGRPWLPELVWEDDDALAAAIVREFADLVCAELRS